MVPLALNGTNGITNGTIGITLNDIGRTMNTRNVVNG